MLAYFSTDGHTFHPQYVKVVNKVPLQSYKAQNITLSLSQRIGRFVKVELYFDNKWLMISEIHLRSQSSTKGLEFNAQDVATESNEELMSNDKSNGNGVASNDVSNELLSDTPEQHRQATESSSKNGAVLNTNGKSNLRAKETNQVRIHINPRAKTIYERLNSVKKLSCFEITALFRRLYGY